MTRGATPLAALAVLLALAGCQVPAAVGPLPNGATVAAAAAAAPPLGTLGLSVDEVTEAFTTVCVATAPDFAGAEAELARRGFVQNAATLTWYDPRREVSVNVSDRGDGPACSMVFASDEDPALLAAALAVETALAGGARTPSIFATPDGGAATVTPAGDGMTFTPRLGGRADLHRAVLVSRR